MKKSLLFLKELLGIDVKSLFDSFLNFYTYDNPNIVKYYTSKTFDYPKENFTNYLNLKKKIDFTISKINFYKGNLKNISYWEIFEKLEDIKTKLEVIPSYPKFYRVGFLKKLNNNKSNYEIYITKQNQSLEDIADDFNIKWEDIALLNSLTEEKYSDKGGVKIILKSNIAETADLTSAPLESVIDTVIGRNVLGKDIPHEFIFDSETQDLKVSSPEETFTLSVKRLFELKMGSIPEFPELGIKKDIMLESVRGDGFYFPILIRQLSNSLFTDDTILNFEITNIDKEGDSLFISSSVQNRLYRNIDIQNKLK